MSDLPEPPEHWRWWHGVDPDEPDEGPVLMLRWTPSPLEALLERSQPYLPLAPDSSPEERTEAAKTILESWHDTYSAKQGWV